MASVTEIVNGRSFEQMVADYKQRIVNDSELSERLDEVKKVVEAKIALLWREFENSNAELIQEAKTAEAMRDIAEDALRMAIENHYLETGDKHPFPGLSARITKQIDYDERRAVEFCIERKMPELLTVKTREFKKQMDLTPQDFCRVTEKVGTVISLKDTPKVTETVTL